MKKGDKLLKEIKKMKKGKGPMDYDKLRKLAEKMKTIPDDPEE